MNIHGSAVFLWTMAIDILKIFCRYKDFQRRELCNVSLIWMKKCTLNFVSIYIYACSEIISTRQVIQTQNQEMMLCAILSSMTTITHIISKIQRCTSYVILAYTEHQYDSFTDAFKCCRRQTLCYSEDGSTNELRYARALQWAPKGSTRNYSGSALWLRRIEQRGKLMQTIVTVSWIWLGFDKFCFFGPIFFLPLLFSVMLLCRSLPVIPKIMLT